LVLKEGQGQGLTSLEFINNQIQTATETYILSKTVRPTSSQSQKNQRPILMNGRAFSKIKKKKAAFCRFKEAKQHSDYRQDAAKRKLPVLNLLTRQKSGFSPRRGDSLHRFMSNLEGPTGTWVRLAVQNFSSIAPEGGDAAPKISKISTFW